MSEYSSREKLLFLMNRSKEACTWSCLECPVGISDRHFLDSLDCLKMNPDKIDITRILPHYFSDEEIMELLL